MAEVLRSLVLFQPELALVAGLAGWNVEVEEPEPATRKFHKDPGYGETKNVEAEIKANLRPYWQCFNVQSAVSS